MRRIKWRTGVGRDARRTNMRGRRKIAVTGQTLSRPDPSFLKVRCSIIKTKVHSNNVTTKAMPVLNLDLLRGI